MDKSGEAYWKATLGLLTKILVVWFLVSFGAGILFADMLNGIHLGGYPLGFWFAHQGSMSAPYSSCTSNLRSISPIFLA